MTFDRPDHLKQVEMNSAPLSRSTARGSLRRRTILSGLGISLAALPLSARAQQATPANAWDVLLADPKFSDAVQLFQYSGLFQYVQSSTFTAFVPTNAAFAKNPDVLPSLLREKSRAFPDTTLAVNFVRSHAIYDLHPLSEFAGKVVKLTTISGNPLTVDGRTPGVFIVSWVSVDSKTGTARVLDKPIVTANALIYPVDTVVLT